MPTLIFPATGFSTGTRFLSTTTAAVDLVRVPGLVKSRATLKTPTSTDYFRIPGKLKSNFNAKNPTPNDFVTLTTVTNITTTTSQLTVTPTVKPTTTLGNLYYFNLVPALRQDRYQNRYNAYTFNISGFETVKSGNLQKQLEIIKNPTPNDFRSYSSPIITQSKTSQLNTEVFILQPDGMLARFKTGAGHGNDITDPNFVPQAPIQFWN